MRLWPNFRIQPNRRMPPDGSTNSRLPRLGLLMALRQVMLWRRVVRRVATARVGVLADVSVTRVITIRIGAHAHVSVDRRISPHSVVAAILGS